MGTSDSLWYVQKGCHLWTLKSTSWIVRCITNVFISCHYYVNRFKGAKLKGKTYRPLFNYFHDVSCYFSACWKDHYGLHDATWSSKSKRTVPFDLYVLCTCVCMGQNACCLSSVLTSLFCYFLDVPICWIMLLKFCAFSVCYSVEGCWRF